MKYGLDVPTTGEYTDPKLLARLAVEAEAAGWDGFFVWDVLLGREVAEATVDPVIALTAVAMATTRMRIGTMVSPLARHKPWILARQMANIDHLSAGRLIITVGLGHIEKDFAFFGEPSDPRTRASKLDEALEVVAGIWAGDDFSFTGEHFTLHNISLQPKPLQAPRIPIWVVGGWPRKGPFRRAARWDGSVLMLSNADTDKPLTPDELRDAIAFMREQRTSDAPFEVVMSGETANDKPEDIAAVNAFAEAGATWWLEEGYGWSLANFRARILTGPPQNK